MPRKQQSVDVYKFGGVSMGTPESVRLAAEHVREAPGPVVAVVSAMHGITNLLLSIGQAALRRDARGWEAGARDFETQHLAEIRSGLTQRQIQTSC